VGVAVEAPREHVLMSPRPLPESLADQAFSTARALDLGVGRGRLRGPDLARPFHGVRVHGARAPTAVRERAVALAPRLRDNWCFSHLTAVALWGLPLPPSARSERTPLHVGALGGRGPRRQGVVGHDLAADVTRFRVDDLPVVDPVVAWCQCSQLLTLDALVAIGDALLGSWSAHPLARARPAGELASAVDARAGTRGAGRLREARELSRPKVESPKETELRLLLHRAGVPEPEINVRRRDDAGRYLGKLDLSWPAHRVSAEYEGDEHRSDPRRWRNDIARAERFADAGWRMVRVTQHDLHGPAAARLVTRFQHLLAP